ERQRLSLARALLSPAQLVVLDEPTAHLDGATEQIVSELIRTLRDQGRTVLVTAHRSRLVEVAAHVVRVEAIAEVDRWAPPLRCGAPAGCWRSPCPGCWPAGSPAARPCAAASPGLPSPPTWSPGPGPCPACWT